MVDRVQVLKVETTALGGDDNDTLPYPAPIAPQEDAIEAVGIYLQDDSNRDETTFLSRSGSDMTFKDGNNSGGLTLSELVRSVSKVGTPANNQLAVWTGDGTIEGESDLTYDGAVLSVTKMATTGPIRMTEVAASDGDTEGTGQIWVKDNTPNDLYFTDDSGVDHLLSWTETEYARLAGRGGGQILQGGTSASEDLTLVSTASSTRGHVYLGAAQTSAFDETNGRLGIGIATPDTLLHLWGATAGTVSPLAGTLLTVENSGDAYLSFLTPNTATSGILLGDPEDNDIGFIKYDHSSNTLSFADGTTGTKTLAELAAGGDVSASGTPVDNQIAIWTDATTIEGVSGLTFNGSTLHVETASAGTISPNADADEFLVEGSAHSGMTIYSGTTSRGGVFFGDGDDDDIGRVVYDHSEDRMYFVVNNSGAVYINSSGQVGIGTSLHSHLLEVDGEARFGSTYYVDIPAYGNAVTFTRGDQNLISCTTASGYLSLRTNNSSATELTVDASGNVGLAGTSPAAQLHSKAASDIDLLWWIEGWHAESAISSTMSGLQLSSYASSATLVYTPAIKFMSTDANFTTENPKLLAYVVGRATEEYAADDDGGMALDFAVTANNGGTSGTATVAMTIESDGDVTCANALTVGSATSAVAGAIQWDGSNFQGYDGGSWVNLDASGGGDVSVSGTPANDQIAVWTNSTTIEGTSALTFDGGYLAFVGSGYPTVWVESTDSSGGTIRLIANSTNYYELYMDDTDALRFYNGSYAVMSLGIDGDVGINVSDPGARFHVRGDNLGGTAGDSVEAITALTYTNNEDEMQLKAIRHTTASTWESAWWRLQRVVDGSTTPVPMGYIGFGSYTDDLITFGENTTEYMRIDGDGNVGIGESDPTHLLHLTTDGVGGNGIFVQDIETSAISPYVRVRGDRTDGNQSPTFSGRLVLEHFRTDAAMDGSYKGYLGTIVFGANHTSGSSANIAYPASIGAVAEGTFSDVNTMPTALIFRTGAVGIANLTTSNVDYGYERVRIDADGNVGIGAASPSAKLVVNDSSNSTTVVHINARGSETSSRQALLNLYGARNGADTVFGNIAFYNYDSNGTSADFIGANIRALNDGADDGRLEFQTASNKSETTKMTIKSNGNVGIGTNSPSRQLHIRATESAYGMLRLQRNNATAGEASLGFYEATGTTDAEAWVVGVGGWSNTSDFVIGQNGVKLMIEDSTGNVGIGTSGPSDNLHVYDGTTATIRVDVGGDYGTISCNSLGRLTILADAGVAASAAQPLDLGLGGTSIFSVGYTETTIGSAGDYTVEIQSPFGNTPMLDFKSSNASSSYAVARVNGGDAGVLTLSSDPDNYEADSEILFYVDGTFTAKCDDNNYFCVGSGYSASAGENVFCVKMSEVGAWAAKISNTGAATTAYGLAIRAGATSPSSNSDCRWIDFLDNGDNSKAYIGYSTSSPYAAFYASSDARLKANIEPTQVDGLDIINRLELSSFDFVDQTAPHQDIGYVAQHVQNVYPAMVAENEEDGMLSVSDSCLIPVLVKAVQQLTKRVKMLEARAASVRSPRYC